MLSLYFAGSILEQVIGRWRFLVLYLVSGLCGAAGALIWTPHGLTVGASGAARCRTVPLLTVEEIDAAAKKSFDYRKPGA